MLNDATIHVNDIHRTIGANKQVHWSETFIFTSQEFLFLVRFPPVEDITSLGNNISFNEVCRRLGYKCITIVIFVKQVAIVDEGCAGCRKFNQSKAIVEYSLHVTAVYTRRRPYRVYT